MAPCRRPRFTHSLTVLVFWLILSPLTASAQIVRDSSLGAMKNQPLVGPNYAITPDLGEIRSSNLFHSFGEFNLNTVGTTVENATFTGPETIGNILTRVSGTSLSNLDGVLRSEIDGAHLYFFNPNGIVFGPNARLDLRGGFAASTADFLRMTDGAKYFAKLTETSTLTSAAITAFGFLSQTPAPITVLESILVVGDGLTLSLIGGNVTIVGGPEGFLAAASGRMEMAAVASPGEVVPTPSDLRLEGFTQLGDIHILEGGFLSTSGSPPGTIHIRGGRVTVDDSTIVSSSFGPLDGGRIDIRATDDLAVVNAGRITSTAFDQGSTGDLIIQAGRLVVRDGSRITTGADFLGNAGNILITVGSLELTHAGRVMSSTSFLGAAGMLRVSATELITLDGDFRTRLSTDSFFASGPAGDLEITTPRLVMNGGQISSETVGGDGNAGDIRLEVARLEMAGGALVTNGTSGAGTGGSITVTASELVSLTDPFTALQSNTNSGGGIGGSVSVTTPTLILSNGALFQTATFPGGGHAGTITIIAGQLTLLDGGLISSDSVFSAGDGGNVAVRATESILIANHSGNPLALTGMTSSALGTGNAGTILVSAPTIVLEEGRITAETFVSGRAGR